MPDAGMPCAGPMNRFDRWAESYGDSQLQTLLYGPVHQTVTRYARRRTRRPVRILDVGCGTGRLLQRVAGDFAEAYVVGVDASAKMLEHATDTVATRTRTGLVTARAERLPFTDAVFDLVLITLSLRHWQDHRAGLAEITRVMATGGDLLVAEALPVDRGRRRRTGLRRRKPALAEELQHSMTSSGLRVEHVTAIHSVAPIAEVSLVLATKRSVEGERPAEGGSPAGTGVAASHGSTRPARMA
jgi:ubiquinone/menaquinone biosynthesis C-methylase UbiE